MISLPLWVEIGAGARNMLASLASVGRMLLQFGPLVGWLELSNYLFAKIQLLSAFFATKYINFSYCILHYYMYIFYM